MKPDALSPFFRGLMARPGPDVFNPWTDLDTGTDAEPTAPAARLKRLKAHLSTTVNYILVGEAPGYQGCHVTGIPFTSERLILAGRFRA